MRETIPFRRLPRLLSPTRAYRLWSETYDSQPNNVVLALDSEVFSELLSGVGLQDKVVIDIGCGTGRHWAELNAGKPRRLVGIDSSLEMLDRLRARHPGAACHLRSATRIEGLEPSSADVLISTLMLGYVRDIETELDEWTRILRPRGELVITDFHPAALAAGARRTFSYRGTSFEVENHLRSVDALRLTFARRGWQFARFEERTWPNTVTDRNGRAIPLVFGCHLRCAP